MHVIDDLAEGSGAGASGSVRVLVVEDDRVERLRLETLLGQAGFEAACAATLIEARVLMRARRFDAAVIDVGLPDGSGLTLVPDLINGEPPCACVVLTGTHDYGVVRKAVQLGVTQFLRKPASPHRVRQALHMALQRSRTLRNWLDAESGDPDLALHDPVTAPQRDAGDSTSTGSTS